MTRTFAIVLGALVAAPGIAVAQTAPGGPEARFMAGMIHHHAQAIVMARWAADHGASPAVQTLAARIAVSQRDEILTMQQWLREHGAAAPDPDTLPPDSADSADSAHSAHSAHTAMPGMLTTEQMSRLDSARGATFDQLFLTWMIQHHEGALTMVEELVRSPGMRDTQVFAIASDIDADQRAEIARMRRMLAAMLTGGSNQ